MKSTEIGTKEDIQAVDHFLYHLFIHFLNQIMNLKYQSNYQYVNSFGLQIKQLKSIIKQNYTYE